MSYRLILIMFLLATVGCPSVALAYVDPGAGSMMLQAVIGVLATGFVFLKFFWGKIKAFFGRTEIKRD